LKREREAKKEQYFRSARFRKEFTDSVKQAKEKIENIHSAVRQKRSKLTAASEPLLEKNAGFYSGSASILRAHGHQKD
jgi:uncharacterized protein YllA (UPF0747 family)